MTCMFWISCSWVLCIIGTHLNLILLKAIWTCTGNRRDAVACLILALLSFSTFEQPVRWANNSQVTTDHWPETILQPTVLKVHCSLLKGPFILTANANAMVAKVFINHTRVKAFIYNLGKYKWKNKLWIILIILQADSIVYCIHCMRWDLPKLSYDGSKDICQN